MKSKLLFLAPASFALACFATGGTAGANEAGAPALAAQGKSLFGQCVACHGRDGAGTSLAPSLTGVVGRRAAGDPDFAYSAAMRRSGKTWTAFELAAFLQKPQAAVPGTRMAFSGAGSPANAAALVEYLQTLH